MSDHHVDSMDIDYSARAKEILLKTGMYIAGAPEINHKPGNDFLSDVLYPFPNYPDTRFSVVDNGLKDTTSTPKAYRFECERDIPGDEEIIGQSILDAGKKRSNIAIEFFNHEPLFDNAVFPYTGLVLKAKEKKAYDITYVKNQELAIAEVITGKLYSIATFDGRAYHIFRGKCFDIIRGRQDLSNGATTKEIKSYFVNATLKMDSVVKYNMRIALDVSEAFESKQEYIPVNQIVDIQAYDYEYDFSTYKVEVGHKDWWELLEEYKDTDVLKTMVPSGPSDINTITYPVYEHQKINPAYATKKEDTSTEE